MDDTDNDTEENDSPPSLPPPKNSQELHELQEQLEKIQTIMAAVQKKINQG